jgi:hypothetical protein
VENDRVPEKGNRDWNDNSPDPCVPNSGERYYIPEDDAPEIPLEDWVKT